MIGRGRETVNERDKETARHGKGRSKEKKRRDAPGPLDTFICALESLRAAASLTLPTSDHMVC